MLLNKVIITLNKYMSISLCGLDNVSNAIDVLVVVLVSMCLTDLCSWFQYHWQSCTRAMVISWHVVSEGVELWKKNSGDCAILPLHPV